MKTATRWLCYVLAVVLLDRVIGSTVERMYDRTKTGETGGVINQVLEKDLDILVMGSSRAKYHVMPSILKAQFPGRVYNAGLDGEGFLYAVMLFDLWRTTHAAPRAIIISWDPDSLLRSEDEMQRASVFSRYFDRSECVREIIGMRGKYVKLKYLSYCYRFNGKLLTILKNLNVRPDDRCYGFAGLSGMLNLDAHPESRKEIPAPEYAAPFWEVKLRYLSELSRYCSAHGTRLFLVHTPIFQENPGEREWASRLAALVSQYPMTEFIDISERTYPETFARRPDLYRDQIHLNASGAAIFSRLLADELVERLAEGLDATARRGSE